jgi:hypothetical protein
MLPKNKTDIEESSTVIIRNDVGHVHQIGISRFEILENLYLDRD